tara:strand:- start:11807 stop:12547 length:741 start_codon:yes stop_codon:yes gene_type:complete
MKSVGLIGLGRFGKILVNILQKGYSISAYDINNKGPISNVNFCNLDKVLEEHVIFIAVPIRSFDSLIKDISTKLKPGTTLIDVCSVKSYPVDVMLKYTKTDTGIIATHPMFGPDSFSTNTKLKMMMSNVRDINKQFLSWSDFFSNQGIEIIEMTPDEHDRLAARSQGVTHFLGRMLKQFGIQKTQIDTQGFKDLLDLVDQTCNDTWDLYTDLQLYNPYTLDIISELRISTESLDKQLRDINDVGKK